VKSYTPIAVLAFVCLTFSVASFAQAAGGGSPASAPTIASALDRSLSSIERNIMNAAQAIPEEKYDFSPATANIPGDFKTPDPVRTLGQQFKHIGDALESYSSIILAEKRPETSDENGPKNVKTKQDVINYLKAPFAKAHTAIITINQQNVVEMVQAGNNKAPRLAPALGMIGHSNNHYGQIIEYLRMNGMVPPESQPRK